MNAKALFENKSIKCRVEFTHDNGKVETKDFSKVSNLVNYCNEHHIDIPLSNCQTVEELPDFECQEEE